MKAYVVSLSLLLSGPVMADELADGMKAWEAQDFARAHQVLGKLASSGNVEAQLMVGEMYGFGEGVPEDFAQAEAWLNKAKAGGHKDAAESLQTIQQRRARKQDIAYYVAGYKGDGLSLASHQCVDPEFPDNSRTKSKIKEVQAQMDAWIACYQGFAKDLQAALPSGKVIPADVAKLMSLSELQQARANMDQVYAQFDNDARQHGTKLLAAHEAWYARVESDQKTRQAETEQQAKILGEVNQKYRDTMSMPSIIYQPNGAPGSFRR